MPPPLEALAAIARLPDTSLSRETAFVDGRTASIQFVLYDVLRHEHALATAAQGTDRSEIARILDLAQMAYGDIVGLLVGRDDELLDAAHDGEWTLRDLLRHAIAVELRYAAQVEWAASRRDEDPLAIPDARLPCDRLSPPEPEFTDTRIGGLTRMLELLGQARSSSDRTLDRLDDTALTRASLWGSLHMSVRMRLHQTVVHLIEVAVQAEKMLGPGGSENEARRIVRRCCGVRGMHERWSDANGRAALDARYRTMSEP